ncbi:MAG: glycosyltransferase family 2 protein [Candidatus Aenigmatarchaeota archaeon]
MRNAVLLPTLNEEEAIGEVLERIHDVDGYDLEPVVIDGLSTDATVKIAKEKGARVLMVREKGKGIAFRAAVGHIIDDYDRFVMLDADMTYPPKYIPRFLELLENCDVVRGVRDMDEENMLLSHHLGNSLFSITATLLYRKTEDLCTGYLGFTQEALRSLELIARGFEIEANIFAQVCKKELNVMEVWVDYDQRRGESNLSGTRDAPKILLMLLKERIRR